MKSWIQIAEQKINYRSLTDSELLKLSNASITECQMILSAKEVKV